MEMEYQEVEVHKYHPVSVGEWIVTFLITAIPLVGIILLFVWAFGSNTHPGKANWAKAILIFIGFMFALYFLIIMVIGVSMASLLNN